MSSSTAIKYLLGKYLDNTCTPEERAWLLDQLAAEDISLEQAIDEYIATETATAYLSEEQSAGILQHILGHPVKTRGTRIRRLVVFSAAAAAVLLTALFGIRWMMREKPVTAAPYSVVTAKGEQRELTMPDGTKVWLSADSRLDYDFSAKVGMREVRLSGEAYFEVAPDAQRPFKVLCRQATVEVLGTAFNISGYEQDSILHTTLLSGSVKLYSGSRQQLLQPGYTGSIGRKGDAINVSRSDTAQVMAWRSGQIVFDNADLPVVINTIARWYNVNVTYTGTIPKKHFLGLVDRKVGLPVMIAFLEENGVHTRLEGRELVILP